jgi:hypothetical protein
MLWANADVLALSTNATTTKNASGLPLDMVAYVE